MNYQHKQQALITAEQAKGKKVHEE